MTICYKFKNDKKERTSISEVIDIFYVATSLNINLFKLVGVSVNNREFPIQHYSTEKICEFVVNYVIDQIENDKKILYIPLEEEIQIHEITGECFVDI